MKKWAFVGSFLCLMLSIISCKKENTTDEVDMIPIIYEAEINTPGLDLQTNEYYKTTTSEGVELKSWIVNGKGVFDTTVLIKKGFAAAIQGYHVSATDWKIRIKKQNGSIIAESEPEPSISGSSYSGTATAVVE